MFRPTGGRCHPTTTLPTVVNTDSGSDVALSPARLGDSDTISDPPLDIDPSVSDVFADPEADGTLSAVPPCVQRLDRNVQELGEVLGREETIGFIHDPIVREDPVSPMLSRWSPSASGMRSAITAAAASGTALNTRNGAVGGFLTGFLTGLLTLG